MVLLKGFNRYETAELTGVDYKRLTYIDQKGLIKPSGKHGRLVLYSLEELVKIMLLDFYKSVFSIDEMEWIIDCSEFQFLNHNRERELVYFKLVKENSIKFIVNYFDENLSIKEFLNRLKVSIDLDEDDSLEDFVIEIHFLKPVNYFIDKIIENSKNSKRVTHEEFLLRAGLREFKAQIA